MKIFNLIFIAILFMGCSEKIENNILQMDYTKIEKNAKGSEVSLYMWGGSKEVNAYFDDYVIPRVKELYDINLLRVPITDVKTVLQKIELEKNAQKVGTTDIIWINGENFKIAKNKELLYGSFLSKLPNFKKYINKNNSSNFFDFSEPTDGLEAPFGRAQFVMIYNAKNVKNPPKNFLELSVWIKANPNRFSYPAPPDFTGSALIRQLFLSSIDGIENFDEKSYKKMLAKFFTKLNELEPFMFQKATYLPSSSALLDTLYAKGSVDFTFSYNPSHALNKIKSSDFPKSSKTAIFEGGSLANTHFLSIARTSPNPAGAMVVIDFLMSPKAQLEKAKSEVWGDGTVLDITKVNKQIQKEFKNLNAHPSLLDTNFLSKNQIPELDSEYIETIEKLWERDVLKK